MSHLFGKCPAVLYVVLPLVVATACTKESVSATKDDLSITPTPTVVSNASNITVEVKGIRSKPVATQLCYSIDDRNAVGVQSNSKRNVTCMPLAAGQTTATFSATNVPNPSYVFVFHDENSNSKLDFTVLNIVVERREAIGEGYAFLEDPASRSDDLRIRRILFVAPGENQLSTTLSYENTALEKFLVEKAWEQIINEASESDAHNPTHNSPTPER
jgi:uncharacterized protein (DUF2141 family)